MTEDDISRIARESAHLAVVETLASLGFDVRESFEIQRDQAFLRTMRLGTRRGLYALITATVTGIATFIGGAIWLALNHK